MGMILFSSPSTSDPYGWNERLTAQERWIVGRNPMVFLEDKPVVENANTRYVLKIHKNNFVLTQKQEKTWAAHIMSLECIYSGVLDKNSFRAGLKNGQYGHLQTWNWEERFGLNVDHHTVLKPRTITINITVEYHYNFQLEREQTTKITGQRVEELPALQWVLKNKYGLSDFPEYLLTLIMTLVGKNARWIAKDPSRFLFGSAFDRALCFLTSETGGAACIIDKGKVLRLTEGNAHGFTGLKFRDPVDVVVALKNYWAQIGFVFINEQIYEKVYFKNKSKSP